VLADAGYARLDSSLLIGGPLTEAGASHEEIILRVLSRLAASIGGRAYPPRLEGIERLLAGLKSDDFAGATLAGCLFSPIAKEQHHFLVAREAGTTEVRQEITPGGAVHWDGRFAVTLPAGTRAGAGGTVAALAEAGWRELLRLWPQARKTRIPHAARLALPALRVGGEIKSVPHLGYAADGFADFRAKFSPLRPLYPDGREGAD
jgi:hypothetical protein